MRLLAEAMDVWVANVSGVVAAKAGIGQRVYRRLGVKLAVVYDLSIIELGLKLHFRNITLTNCQLSLKHNRPYPIPTYSGVSVLLIIRKWIPPHFATAIASSLCIGNECNSSPLPLTALCMNALHLPFPLCNSSPPWSICCLVTGADRCELCMLV